MTFEELLNDPVIQKHLHELVRPVRMPVVMVPPDGEVTDEGLVEELRPGLNDIRHALFILYKNDLASYRCARNEDSGWLTYLWTFYYKNIPENLGEEMYRLLDAFGGHLDYEHNYKFYLSGPAGTRSKFSEVVEHDFRYPETGAQLEPMDSDGLVGAMERHIEELRDELNVEMTGAS